MTSDVVVGRDRLAAANAARRRARTHRLMVEVAARLDDADDEHLAALYGVVVAELEVRRAVRSGGP